MDIEKLKSQLIKSSVLKNLIYLEEIDSTNNYAKLNNVETDTIIVTDNQFSGRGRFNRIWYSTNGEDATFTIVKDLPLIIDEIYLVNFYVSLILLKTLLGISAGLENKLFLKWPNDLLINSRKISGILTEVKDLSEPRKTFIIGVGVNLNSNEFNENLGDKATSVFAQSGEKTDREQFIISFVKNFYDYLDHLKRSEFLIKEWKKHSRLIGSKVSFKIFEDSENLAGVVDDIDVDGALILRFDENSIKKILFRRDKHKL